MGGQVPFMLAESAGAMPLITAGKVRALAVGTVQRMVQLPEVPTLQEQGVAGYEAFAWQGLSVPAGASPAAVARYSKALQRALDSTFVKARFQALGVETMPGSPEQMNRFARRARALGRADSRAAAAAGLRPGRARGLRTGSWPRPAGCAARPAG
jgi:tripartite-type tricarboxylate transporter receptor subunit TctC